jgi:hypothetical protein
MRKITKKIGWLIVALSLYPNIALAAGIAPPLGVPEDLCTLTSNIVNLVMGILAVILFLILVWGGVTYMTAGGNDEQTTKGRKIIFDGIIGLVIVLAAYAIGRYVISSVWGNATFFAC